MIELGAQDWDQDNAVRDQETDSANQLQQKQPHNKNNKRCTAFFKDRRLWIGEYILYQQVSIYSAMSERPATKNKPNAEVLRQHPG